MTGDLGTGRRHDWGPGDGHMSHSGRGGSLSIMLSITAAVGVYQMHGVASSWAARRLRWRYQHLGGGPLSGVLSGAGCWPSSAPSRRRWVGGW